MNIKNVIANVLYKISPIYHMRIQNANAIAGLSEKLDRLGFGLQERTVVIKAG